MTKWGEVESECLDWHAKYIPPNLNQNSKSSSRSFPEALYIIQTSVDPRDHQKWSLHDGKSEAADEAVFLTLRAASVKREHHRRKLQDSLASTHLASGARARGIWLPCPSASPSFGFLARLLASSQFCSVGMFGFRADRFSSTDPSYAMIRPYIYCEAALRMTRRDR